MTKIELTVTGTDIQARVNGPLTGGMVGTKVHIQYNREWDGLKKILVCRSSVEYLPCDEVRTVLDVDAEATVAHEVMIPGRRLYLGLEGRNEEGTEVYPTIWADCGIIQPGANGSAAITAAAAPEVWQQLLLQMGDLSSLHTDDKENLVAAINEAMTKGDGAPGADGAPGENGRGIASITGNDDGSWTVTFDDGTAEVVSSEAYTTLRNQVEQHSADSGNPHGVTAEQVGARPDTWTPMAEEVGAAPATESTEYLGCYYRTVDGETEWINPPMELGIEYRTTQRHNGLPVYVKRVDGGTMPASGYKDIAILGSAKIFSFRLSLISASGGVYMQKPECYACAVSGGGTIRVFVTSDMSAYTVGATAKYTKT